MTTTVPQNFAKNASTLIGRHKPTRSSLRHSRMLVVNKTVPVRYPPGNSLNLRHLRLCRTLMVLQILIGIVLNVIGLNIMVWSPSTSTKDNPYWSGLIVSSESVCVSAEDPLFGMIFSSSSPFFPPAAHRLWCAVSGAVSVQAGPHRHGQGNARPERGPAAPAAVAVAGKLFSLSARERADCAAADHLLHRASVHLRDDPRDQPVRGWIALRAPVYVQR